MKHIISSAAKFLISSLNPQTILSPYIWTKYAETANEDPYLAMQKPGERIGWYLLFKK